MSAVADLHRVLVHTVEVHPCQRSAIVANNNAVWIHHWHKFKDKMVAETLWGGKEWRKRRRRGGGGEEEEERRRRRGEGGEEEEERRRRRGGGGEEEKEPLKILALTKDCNITATLLQHAMIY